MATMFLCNWDEMRKPYRGPFIYASYKISLYLAKWFQRRRFLESTNQKQEMSMVAMLVNGLGRNE
jgi:hypothetical protein